MPKETILVVDDEEDVLELVHYHLSREDYLTETATSGEEAVRKASAVRPALIILDIMLPGVNGLQVCRTLKKDSRTADIPILMLTARSEESDIVAGLDLGADDYVTKPFSAKVLLARVRRILQRTGNNDLKAPIHVHDLVIDPARHEVLAQNCRIELTLSEFNTLYTLAKRPGQVFTRYQIVNAVHGEDYIVTDRTIDVQIVSLRKKLGPCGKYIETVRGIGYRFRDYL